MIKGIIEQKDYSRKYIEPRQKHYVGNKTKTLQDSTSQDAVFFQATQLELRENMRKQFVTSNTAKTLITI